MSKSGPECTVEPPGPQRLPVQVFAAKDWAALMANSIIPKLAVGLQTELSLAPGASNLTPWHSAMAWAGLLAPEQLVQLLEQSFFPQWHTVLHHWLAHAPNYDQVTAWYLQWKVRPCHTLVFWTDSIGLGPLFRSSILEFAPDPIPRIPAIPCP